MKVQNLLLIPICIALSACSSDENNAIDGLKSAIFQGVDKLYGANVFASDLRAGAALIIAGIVASRHYRNLQCALHR